MSFKKALEQHIEGPVRFDAIIRAVYSTDTSIYEVKPLGVVFPKTAQDVARTLKIAREHKIPVTARGAATGVNGGCLGEGLILDTSRFLNRLLEIDIENETVTCEPGAVYDVVNQKLAEKGYRIGPSTSTGNRATVGGMLANNAAGAHSLLYGSTGDHTLSVDLAEADGTINTYSTEVPNALKAIADRTRDEIETRFPPIRRMASGYFLPALLEGNMCRFLAGSEGTLGIATKITFRIVKALTDTSFYVLPFSSLSACFRAILPLLELKPIALELIDKEILDAGKRSPTMRSRMGWLGGDPAAVLAVEFASPPPQKELHAASELGVKSLDEAEQADIWAVRKAGLELLLSRRSYTRATAFIEDITIPPKNLPRFIDVFTRTLKEKNRTAGIYGHAGEGCLHIRPFINIYEPADQALMQTMAEEVSRMVQEHEGVMSGEHGDGRVRTWLNEKIFSKPLIRAMEEIKAHFDPDGILNPGNVVKGPPLLNNLRRPPKQTIETFQDFSKEGGFELAVDLCNGNGLCRKREGVMCPSFQATGNEYDSTRARANALRSLINGQLKAASLTHPDLVDILDLCLSCKGCQKECPSQVDMSKMKHEVLHQVRQQKGATLRDTLFAHIATVSRLSSVFPKLSQTGVSTWLAGKLGITDKRPLPEPAKRRFSKWFSAHQQPQYPDEVTLFNDTYCEFYEPEIGISAVQVLNAMGYTVSVPKWTCCGRPLISKGFLPEAKKQLEALLKKIKPGKPVLFLEPSCLSVLIDDIHGLIADNALSPFCMSLETFITQNRERLPLKELPEITLHGHCHQKSLWGTSEIKQLFTKCREIPSGCCGAAGSFGYETEHYDLSMKMGALTLFPEVEKAQSPIVANGFSCRSQISHGTSKRAHHFIEVLDQLL